MAHMIFYPGTEGYRVPHQRFSPKTSRRGKAKTPRGEQGGAPGNRWNQDGNWVVVVNICHNSSSQYFPVFAGGNVCRWQYLQVSIFATFPQINICRWQEWDSFGWAAASLGVNICLVSHPPWNSWPLGGELHWFDNNWGEREGVKEKQIENYFSRHRHCSSGCLFLGPLQEDNSHPPESWTQNPICNWWKFWIVYPC